MMKVSDFVQFEEKMLRMEMAALCDIGLTYQL